MKMKSALLFLSFIVVTISTMGQNLSLSNDNGPLAMDETIYIWGDSGQYSTIYCYLHVTNNSAADIDVLLKKTEIDILAGTENSFCWGNCYLPIVFVSPDFITIGAGQTNELSFSGDYMPKGQVGLSTILYTFYNKSNPADSVAVNVVFGSGTASIDGIETENELAAYPNPATSQVNFTYQSENIQDQAQLIIMSAAGSEVYRAEMPNDNSPFSIDLSNFNSGIYYYSVLVNGRASEVRKLVVMH